MLRNLNKLKSLIISNNTQHIVLKTIICNHSSLSNNGKEIHDDINQLNQDPHQSIEVPNNNSHATIQKKLQNTDYNNIRPKPQVVQYLNKIGVLPTKSIFLSQFATDEEEQQDVDKQLSTKQKQHLGLYLPKPPYNPRMTRKNEQQYRPILCEQLYQKQKQKLKAEIRILELTGVSLSDVNVNDTNNDKQGCTIDQYINAVYKDIYARYFINKGLGVQWNARYHQYGVVNPKKQKTIKNNSYQQSYPSSTKHIFYSWLTSFISEYQLQRIQTLYLYSYGQKQYIPLSSQNVKIENIYKIGYYFQLKLSGFGKQSQSFSVLQQRGQQINMLVFIDDIAKILDAKGLIIQSGKFIILKKSIQSQTKYLITSMQIYAENRDFFIKQGYTKHQLFNSDYLLGMQAQITYQGVNSMTTKKLIVYNQIDGYKRKQGIYLFNSQTNLGDWERTQQYDLNNEEQENIINEEGIIRVNGGTILVTDIQYQQKLIKVLKLDKFPLYGTFEDQIYYYLHDDQKIEKLHYRKTNRYRIQISEDYKSKVMGQLFDHDSTVITQSKIQVPPMKLHYPKARDKRRHRKQIKSLKQQVTDYLSLRECLQNVDGIIVDKIAKQGNHQNLQIPIIILKHKTNNNNEGSKQQILKYNHMITDIVLKSLKISNNNLVNWDLQSLISNLTEHLQSQNIIDQSECTVQIQLITLSDKLIKGFLCLKQTLQKQNDSLSLSQSKINNVIIQPQSSTEDIIPYFIYLFHMTHKLLHKQHGSHGRVTKRSPRFQPLSGLFSMIKLHPTLIFQQKNKSVAQLLYGVIKLNNKQQYGYGLQALRLWIAKNDQYKGDRDITQRQINQQIKFAAFMRKLYWEIIPLFNIPGYRGNYLHGLNMNMNKQQQQQIGLQSQFKYNYEQLPYLHKFMHDHINYYLLNMDNALKSLQLTDAYSLTKDFFQNYVHQILVKTIRYRMITYPLNTQEHQKSLAILHQVIKLLGLLQPLLPYSVFHITKQSALQFPQIPSLLQQSRDLHMEKIPIYNRMTKLRVEIQNKIILNKFNHSEIVIPMKDIIQNGYNIDPEELAIFLGVQSIRIEEPTEKYKSFHLKLKQHHPIGDEIQKLAIYEYRDVCFRCSPDSFKIKNRRRINKGLQPEPKYLCGKCLDYINCHHEKLLPA